MKKVVVAIFLILSACEHSSVCMDGTVIVQRSTYSSDDLLHNKAVLLSQWLAVEDSGHNCSELYAAEKILRELFDTKAASVVEAEFSFIRCNNTTDLRQKFGSHAIDLAEYIVRRGEVRDGMIDCLLSARPDPRQLLAYSKENAAALNAHSPLLEGGTVVHCMARNRYKRLLAIAFEHKANPNALDIFLRTPLCYAVMTGSAECALQLLRENATFNGKDVLGNTVLHYAVCQTNTDLVRFRPETIDSTIKNNDGNTALHLAVIHNTNEEAVECLLSFDFLDFSLRNNEGERPLDIVMKRPQTNQDIRNEQLIRSVLNSRLSEAIADNRCKDVAMLLRGGATTDGFDVFLRVPLYYAIKNKCVSCLQALINTKIALNEADEYGKIPLNYAIEFEFYDGVALLLHAGAQVYGADRLTNIPLRYAIIKKDDRNIRILLNHGALVTGDLLALASDKGNTQAIIDLLKKGYEKNTLVTVRK